MAKQETRSVEPTTEQNPVVYRYNGNAAAGESLMGVPLADIRQSTWDELAKHMRASVEASPLYTKAEAK